MSNEINLKVQAECPEQKEEAKFKEWEIEDAARTLMRAEEIKQDAEMMALVQPKLQKRFSSFVANMAASLDPILAKKINGEKMIDAYADYANIDPSQVTPSEEIAQINIVNVMGTITLDGKKLDFQVGEDVEDGADSASGNS